MSIDVERQAPVADAPKATPTPTAGDNQQDQAEPKTDDTAASAETQDGTDTTDEGQAPKKKGDGGFQRRINRLTADYRAAEARAAAAEAKAQELERRQAIPTKSDDDPRPPRLEDFKSYEDYERADRQFVADKATRDAEKRYRESERQRAEKEAREARDKQMTAARERFEKSAETVAENYEDFADVMDDMWRGRVPVIAKNDAIAAYIIEESDRGPELAYHLATNEKDAERIGKLSPLAQVRELVKLEASLAKPKSPATNAPPPPRQVGSRGGSDGKDPEKMTIDEMRKVTGTIRKVRPD